MMTKVKKAPPMPSRERMHQMIRDQLGDGEPLDRFIAMANRYHKIIDSALLICARYPGEFQFERIAKRARTCRKALDHELDHPCFNPGFGSLGHWGENGNGPAVADLLRQAESFERMRGQ